MFSKEARSHLGSQLTGKLAPASEGLLPSQSPGPSPRYLLLPVQTWPCCDALPPFPHLKFTLPDLVPEIRDSEAIKDGYLQGDFENSSASFFLQNPVMLCGVWVTGPTHWGRHD